MSERTGSALFVVVYVACLIGWFIVAHAAR